MKLMNFFIYNRNEFIGASDSSSAGKINEFIGASDSSSAGKINEFIGQILLRLEK
jgi:hypothetical protein